MSDTYCKRVENETILRGFSKAGEIALCCKSQDPFPMDTDINELQKVKYALQDGYKHPHCNFCWRQEEKGIKSWRQIGNEIEMNYRNVEIYLDNTCDLACVYCSPKYSSSWSQEIKFAKNNNIDIKDYINEDPYDKQKEQYNHLPKILSYIEQLGREAKESKPLYLCLLGGEPLLSTAFKKDIIDAIVSAFYKTAHRKAFLGINIVTNCNTPDPIINKCIKKIKQNKQMHPNLDIHISVSVEGTGERAEYVRYGLDWNQFHKNLRKWLMLKECSVSFSMAVNLISWKSTPGFFEWAFYIAKEHGQKISFQFNTVMYPLHLSINMLPQDQFFIFDEIEKICIKNKEQFPDEGTYNRFMIQVEQAKNKFSSLSTDKELINKTIKYIDYIKKYRKKDINDFNPELHEYLISQRDGK